MRDDLYYLIAGARVALPPLRERDRPDVLALLLATKIAGRRVDLGEEAAAMVRSHSFPGSVRELSAAMSRALMTASGDRLTPVDLRPTSIAAGAPMAVASPGAQSPQLVHDDSTQIRDALASSGWIVSEAVRRLGISRATVNRKIRLHGLARPA